MLHTCGHFTISRKNLTFDRKQSQTLPRRSVLLLLLLLNVLPCSILPGTTIFIILYSSGNTIIFIESSPGNNFESGFHFDSYIQWKILVVSGLLRGVPEKPIPRILKAWLGWPFLKIESNVLIYGGFKAKYLLTFPFSCRVSHLSSVPILSTMLKSAGYEPRDSLLYFQHNSMSRFHSLLFGK